MLFHFHLGRKKKLAAACMFTCTAALALWLGICLEKTRPGFDSCFRCGSFSRLSRVSDLKIGTPVAALPSAWRVMAGTGWPDVSIL